MSTTESQALESFISWAEHTPREVLDALGVAVYTTDAEGIITFYNDAAADLWGRRPVLGRDLWCGSWRLFYPDSTPLPHDECPLALALKQDRVVRGVEAIAERPDGSRVWFMPYPTPLHDPSGRLTGAVNVLVDITEQKQAELAVRESEAFHRELLDGIGVAVYTTDAEGRVTMFNEAAAAVWGREPEIGVDRWCGSIRMLRADGTELPHEECPMAVALRDKVSVRDTEAIVERPDGSRIWVTPYPTPLVNAAGEITGAVNVFLDITRRKQAEAAREEALAHLTEQWSILETIEETAEILAGELDLDKALQAVTDASTRLTEAEFGAFFYNVYDDTGEQYLLYTLSGADPSPFAGFPQPRATSLFGPTFRGEGPVRIDNLLDDGKYGNNPPYSGMPEGHLPVRSYLAVPVKSPTGAVLGGLFFGHTRVGVFTQRHEDLAEGLSHWAGIVIENAGLYEKTNQAAEVLRQSEERYRFIFESAGIALREEDFSALTPRIKRLKAQGVTDFHEHLRSNPELVDDLIGLIRVVDVNQEAVRVFEAGDKSDLLDSLAPFVTDETRDAIVDELAAFAAGEAVISSETVVQTLRGKRINVLFTVAFAGSSPKFDRVLINVLDITERKRAEEEIRESMALKDQFLSLISHELRTPLSTIYGSSRLLRDRFDAIAESDRTDLLNDVVAESSRLQRIIENLLLMTRLDAGELELKPISLDAIVERSVESFRERHPDLKVGLSTDGTPQLVLGNETYVELVVENLISNAAKYSPPEMPIDVALSFSECGEVRVLDRGIGLAPEDGDMLFTPFYRSAAAKAWASGVGVGLTVCKRIIEAQGGSIWAQVRTGGGSEFGFSLQSQATGNHAIEPG